MANANATKALSLDGLIRVTDREFGARGDGTTDDTLAIRRAITAAGEDGQVWFPPNTYLISGSIELLSGQTVWGYGATLKRRAQINTTTTTTITSGFTTSVTVADATGLAVGMDICFSQGSQPDLVAGPGVSATLSSVLSRITAINGNVVTFSGVPNASFTGTTDVHLAFYSIECVGNNRVLGMTFDGNRANWSWSRWEVVNEIILTGDDNHVIGCGFVDAAGEGIVPEGDYHVVRDCWGTDFTGNAVHFGGANHPLVDGCAFRNGNLGVGDDPEAGDIGHQDGGIIWSNTITDATVVNNYVSGFISGIGSINSAINSDCTIAGNTIRDCTVGVDVNGLPANVLVTKNRVYDCTNGINVGTGAARGIKFDDNLFSASPVAIGQTTGLEFTRNTLRDGSTLTVQSMTAGRVTGNQLIGCTLRFSSCTDTEITGNLLDFTGDQSTHPIACSGVGNARTTIAHNRVIGGSRGIDISQSGSEFWVERNVLIGQFTHGIFISTTGSLPGTKIEGNTVSTTSNSGSFWNGIRTAASAVTIAKNHVSHTRGSGNAQCGVRVAAKCLVDGNTIRGTFGGAGTPSPGSIIVDSGVTGATLVNNCYDSAINDLGTTTVTANNTTVS